MFVGIGSMGVSVIVMIMLNVILIDVGILVLVNGGVMVMNVSMCISGY